MAYAASQTFKTNIKSGERQNFLLRFSDMYLSANDGDFESAGATITDYFVTGTELRYGEVPSSTLDFSAMNLDGALAGYGFGEAKAYVGVEVSEAAFTMPVGAIAYASVGGHDYTANGNGLYKDGTLVQSGNFHAIFATDEKVMAVGTSECYTLTISSGTVAATTPSHLMVRKATIGKSEYFDGTNGISYFADTAVTYEYVPLGVFIVKQPQTTLADVVTVSGAMDRMTLFDVDAAEFRGSVTYPITVHDLVDALCTYCGAPLGSASWTNSSVSIESDPFPTGSALTCRNILAYVAEYCYCTAMMDRGGELVFKWLGTLQEALGVNEVPYNNLQIAEYETEITSGVILKANNGVTLIFGSKDNPYSIYGNPFITTISESTLQNRYKALMTFTPVSCGVITPDPSVDVGDIVTVQPMVETYAVYADAFNQVFIDLNDNVLIAASTAVKFPLLERTLTFNGVLRATYTANADKLRPTPDAAEYNSIASVEQAAKVISDEMTQQEIFNRLTNNGEVQGLYLQDGKIYINAEYIKAGVLSGISINNGSGTFTVDASGNVVANSLSSNSASISGGSIGGINISGSSISSANGKFSVSSAGAVVANSFSSSSATITGGTINMSGAAASTEGIKLYLSGTPSRYTTLTPEALRAYGNNYVATVAPANISLSYNGHVRVEITINGITFYNSSGTVTRTYPAT